MELQRSVFIIQIINRLIAQKAWAAFACLDVMAPEFTLPVNDLSVFHRVQSVFAFVEFKILMWSDWC